MTNLNDIEAQIHHLREMINKYFKVLSEDMKKVIDHMDQSNIPSSLEGFQKAFIRLGTPLVINDQIAAAPPAPEQPKRSEADFLDWLSGASIYIGYARYSQFPGNFVCTTSYGEDDRLKAWTEDLDAGDDDACRAGANIHESAAWYGSNNNPALAMDELVEKLRVFYFNELNKD